MAIKILVVDDEPDLELLIRQKFRKQIRDRELEFFFAHNGVEALKMLVADRDIDVVLTDINMPEMDGLTLLSKLHGLGQTLKAVIVSAYGDMDNIRTAMNRGAFDFLTKPIDFQDFEITLSKTLKEMQTLKEALKTHNQLVAFQQELSIAGRIQQSILPRRFPPFPERSEFEIYAEMIPARGVGGDFYDFFLIDDERLGFVIGDVSGKGIPAAIYMAMSRTFLKASALRGVSPGECLQHVNGLLCAESDSGMFVTIVYGILHTRTGALDYSLGGHYPPYRLGVNGQLERLPATGGMVLGVVEGFPYNTNRVELQPGDALLLYTDGVTEAMDHEENLFSDQRLETFLAQIHNGSPLNDIVRSVVSEVRSYSAGVPQTDDITVLALRYLQGQAG
jgi:sigma-B regulation protein RsbU (phosphoserine phosphatase)